MLQRILVAAAVLSLAAPALAQTESAAPISEGGFGSKHTLALSSDIGGQIGYESVGGNGAFVLTLRPAADYFFMDHLSLGGVIGFSLTAASGNSITNFVLQPRVGYQVPLNPKLDIWPRFALQLGVGSASVNGNGFGGGGSQTTFGIVLDAPLLYKPAGHFFLGGGPTLTVQFVGDVKTIAFTLDFIIGGWL